ncbi:MAG TPA: lysophospholipid acyltransferase family protein [Dehalococcoidia bacterium]|nr:lysophospholipid acyltransferase family protein [Dehalococcoidia bacterium]
MNLAVYWGATWFSKFVLLPPYCSIRVTGLENVPREGAIVIASNHLNDADPGVICTRFPRHVVYMAKDELFRVPLLGWFLRSIGSFPVRRNEADLTALRKANEALAQGLAVCIFPEGTRSAGGAALLEGWPGAALIALRNDTPVLPIAITGSQRLSLPLMFLRPYRRDKVTLTIGKPFHLPKPARVNAESAKEGTRIIMEHIAALLPESYRGYYGYMEPSNQ